jgi:flavine halogenase
VALPACWCLIHTVRLSFSVLFSLIPGLRLSFLIVVLSAYKQIRAQSKDVLCDVGEDNFDKAFSFLRPGTIHTNRCIPTRSSCLFTLVIQGNADLGPRLSEVEVQNAIEFCAALFNPINPDAASALRKHFEGINLNAEGVPASILEGSGMKDADTQTKLDMGPVPHSVRKRSGTIDAVRKWLGKVSGISEESAEPEPGTRCPPTATAAAPERPSLLSRRRSTISSINPSLQAPNHSRTDNLHQGVTTTFIGPDVPLLPPLEIRNIARDASLLPPASSAAEAEAEIRRILEKINARHMIHREHNGLHSLEEEALGAGYGIRLQRGSLGLLPVESSETRVAQD